MKLNWTILGLALVFAGELFLSRVVALRNDAAVAQLADSLQTREVRAVDERAVIQASIVRVESLMIDLRKETR